MEFFLWGIFAIVVCVQLYACLREKLNLRASTKGFVVLSLSACYLLLSPEIDPVFVLGLMLCLLGDMLLIPRNTFETGGFSFLLAHIFFIAAYKKYIDPKAMPLWFFILLVIAYLGVVFAVMRLVRRVRKGPMVFAAAAYLSALCVHSIAAATLLFTQKSLPSALIFAGTLSFLVSDCMIVLRQFKVYENIKRAQFRIMSTYVIAMALIVIGFLNIGG